MKNRILRCILAFGMMIAVSMSASDSVVAKNSNSELTEKAESTSLSDAQKEKKALEKELEKAQELIEELKGSQGDVKDKISELNTNLIAISERITALENQLAEKNNEIIAAKEELEIAKETAAKQYEDMKLRIQFMYENGQDSYLEMLLSSGSVAEFLNSAEYIAQIQSYDREKLDVYEQTVLDITEMEAQLEQDYKDLETLKATVETEKENVAALMRQKEVELAGIEADISDALDEEEYYKAEIQAQEELIAEIKRIEAERLAAGDSDNPYNGGAFTWPVPSSYRVTSDYGPRVSPTAGASSNHKGIDIGAPYGSNIVAAADGKVTTVKYSSSAGNYVMLSHGGGLYTVYMHCSSTAVTVGQEVAAGDVIAYVGSTGISTGNHLHFGVSLNGSYVSPWNYLGRP